MAAHRGAGRVVLEVPGVRALEVVHRALLQRVDGLRAALYGAARPVPGHRVTRVLQTPVPVHSAGGGRGREKLDIRRDAPRGVREHEPERRLVGPFTLRLYQRVVGERLHGFRRAARAERQARLFLGGDGVEPADRERAGPPGQLGRADDRRLQGHRGEAALGHVGRPVRLAADPPRVEEARAGAVVAVEVEAQIPGALDEERPTLGVKRLERRQVDHGRVGLDLAEVRVDGRRHGQPRSQGVLDVGADRTAGVRRLVEGVSSFRGLRADLGHAVGHDFEALPASGELQPAQFAELRHETGAALRDERPRRGLVEPANLPDHAKPECVPLPGLEPQLRQRDPELRLPSLSVARHGDVPHGVPALVAVAVGEPVAVLLHAGRVYGELVRRAPVVIRVDDHSDPVRRRWRITPGPDAHDPVRLAIEGAHGHVDVRRVVGDPHLAAERRRRTLARVALDELGDGHRARPDRFAELPVEAHRGGARHFGGLHARRRGGPRTRSVPPARARMRRRRAREQPACHRHHPRRLHRARLQLK